MINFNRLNALYAWMNSKMMNRYFKFQNVNITSIPNAVQNGFLVKIKEEKKDALYAIQFSKLMKSILDFKSVLYIKIQTDIFDQ